MEAETKRKIKTISVHILKLSIALGLVIYMIYTKKLDLRAIYETRSNYHLLVLAFFCLLSAILINFYRWNLLLKGQEIYLKRKNIISLCFIGLFFTTVLPGAVGGDLVKSVYIARETPNKRTAAVLTVLLDRVIGLFALIIIACIGLIFNYKVFMQQASLRALGITIYLILLGFICVFLLALSRRIYRHRITQYIMRNLPFSKIINKIYDAFHAYRYKHKYLTYSLLVSFVTHTFNITAFYIITRALGFNLLDISSYLFIVPLGMITTAIPLAPAGIGIGQAAFLKLFEWSLGMKITIGADAITIWQIISITIFMIGGFFYITHKREKAQTTSPHTLKESYPKQIQRQNP